MCAHLKREGTCTVLILDKKIIVLAVTRILLSQNSPCQECCEVKPIRHQIWKLFQKNSAKAEWIPKIQCSDVNCFIWKESWSGNESLSLSLTKSNSVLVFLPVFVATLYGKRRFISLSFYQQVVIGFEA